MGAAVEQLQRCGADLIHCDVMDGSFVPKITFGADMVAAVKKHTSLPLDVHLMVVEPQNKIDDFVKAGADYLTFHYEACGERSAEVLRAIRSNGVKAGISVSPDTPVEKVLPLLEEADMLLVMSVYPGKGGQKFIEHTLSKAETARKFFAKHGFSRDVEIDGGINEENAARVKAAGVNILVAGNTVFRSPDMAKTISFLRDVK